MSVYFDCSLYVKLLHYTPLEFLVKAIRKSHDSENAKHKTDDKTLIKNVIKLGHTSVLEHIVYSFEITHLSRAALQELARHRIASMTVKSTRYTLNKKDWEFRDVVLPPELKDVVVDYVNKLHTLQKQYNIPNDVLKYAMPELLSTDLVWTINARSLRNFFSLRFSKEALLEMNELSLSVLDAIRDVCPDHLVLFEEWDLSRYAKVSESSKATIEYNNT